MSKQYADMTYRLSDGRETTYKVELLPESEWPSREQEIWFQAGVTAERERIIKLLEESVKTTGISLDADSNFYQGLKQAIELIKRKTK